MIADKKITVTVNNSFDRGWAVFRPFDSQLGERGGAFGLAVGEIVKRITKAEHIDLVLSEICLSSTIVNELQWVSQYIDINLIAKDQKILSFFFEKMKLATVKVDPSVTVNYLAIMAKEPFFVLVSDGYVETDATIRSLYFGDSSFFDAFDLSQFRAVYVIDATGKPLMLDTLAQFTGAGVHTSYVVQKQAYSREMYRELLGVDVGILVADVCKDGIVAEDGEGNLFLLHRIRDAFLFKERIYDIRPFFSGAYVCCCLPEECSYSELPFDAHLWTCGALAPISITAGITVRTSVRAEDMSAFVEERFDREIMEKHNTYACETKTVTYEFTLSPPILSEGAKLSRIYVPLTSALSKWRAQRSSLVEECAQELLEIAPTSKLYHSFSKFKMWDEWLKKAINEYDFRDFSKKLAAFSSILRETTDNLLSYMREAYTLLEAKSDDGRFDKLDAEIAGYEQTIAEKQKLVDTKVDVISNRRRIEILQKKIADLRALKERFTSTSGTRTEMAEVAFLAKCRGYLEGVQSRTSDDSLSHVIKAKGEGGEGRLDSFASRYLSSIHLYLKACLQLLEKIKAVDIPDDYTVYEDGGCRMIVINAVEEFYDTREIQKKYNLNCVVRR